METRANYVLIGGFVLGILFAAFVFIYWLAATVDSRQSVNVKVIFPGPVTGLPIGGQVLFNGIKIGDVGSLDFDQTDPQVVIATIRVNPNAPLRRDIRATLGFQGLTGVAYVDLKGGSTETPLLIQPDMESEPVIYADRSFFDDILENGRDVLKKADTTLDTLNSVLQESRPAISEIVRNVETFSKALAENADGVEGFMASVGKATEAFSSLSGRMEGLVEQGERILAAVPSDKVEEMVGNVTDFTASLKEIAPDIRQMVAEAESATANLQQFTERLNAGMDGVEAVIKAVRPEDVEKAVAGAGALGAVLEKRSAELDTLIASTGETMDNIRSVSSSIRAREEDISAFIAGARDVVGKIGTGVERTTEVVQAIDPQKVSNIVASVEEVTGKLSGQGEAIEATIASARNAAGTIEKMSADLSARTADVDQIITDAKQIATNLNAASARVDEIVSKVGTMVDGDGEGFIVEATRAAEAIRKVAEAFESRADGIASGLSKFANQGTADLTAALGQVNRTFVSIQRAVENFDRNPNRVIFGGEDVPRFGGGQRR
ncbi:MlaD family protein [Polymorphum gilvum]|uniref:ABC transporter, substrate binding protein n=1 Tax=Polymorphum gilvum (strain LMG 25793 / CGMCC 1.9160 / SL003B-26A1) TaxID=991905 RepID=F2J3B6_POLGS|nr:MlaD family protein [Polymorphum gilvum]ADZ69923.1 ABC transporter, substrate binding protein [Polymorphum gilvum SL003B-26A1]